MTTNSSPIVNNKSLSIRIATDGLSFCVYSPAESQPYTYRKWKMNHLVSLAANLKAALTNEPMLQQLYKRVNVLVASPQYTTLPLVEFNRESISDIFSFVFPTSEPQHVSYNLLRHSGVAIIFGLDKVVHQLIIDDFPHARFYAAASTLIEHLGEKSLIGIGKHLFAYLHDKEMSLYAFDQGRMLLSNSYSVGNTDDCQYYLLQVWQQLGFEQLSDKLSIITDEQETCPLTERMRYFIKNVSEEENSKDAQISTSDAFAQIPYDLQTLLVCGF